MKQRDFELPRRLLEIADNLPDELDSIVLDIQEDLTEDLVSSPEEEQNSISRTLKDQAENIDVILGALPEYNLEPHDLLLLAVLFKSTLENIRQLETVELIRKLYRDTNDILNNLLRVRQLVAKGILDIRGVETRQTAIKVVLYNDNKHEEPASRYSLVELMRSTLVFREDFLRHFLRDPSLLGTREEMPYETNREFLEGWFLFIAALSDLRSTLNYSVDEYRDTSDEEARLRDVWKEHSRRLELTTQRFPFQELAGEENLDETEQHLVLYLLREEMKDNSCSVQELVEFISENRFEQYQNQVYLEPQSKLITRGLVEVSGQGMLTSKRRNEVWLAPDISRRILSRKPQNDEEHIQSILRGETMFELVKPTRSLDEVILPGDLKRQLETACQRYHAGVDNKLREWGFDKSTRELRSGEQDEAPLLLLFSGPSGTGKTLSAEAFAHRLGRPLLRTDVSKIVSMWVGESEKGVTRLFYMFDKIVRRCDNPPVLLLNECDQFLGKRHLGKNGSVDRMYHQMQNLFLEGFERMRGIMIATTNLADSMDPAFSRRFQMKLEFPEPGYEERLALWALYLDNGAPQEKDIDAEELARKYSLTGGQIMVIVRNAAIEAATDSCSINQAMLVKYIKRELDGASRVDTGKLRAPIGY